MRLKLSDYSINSIIRKHRQTTNDAIFSTFIIFNKNLFSNSTR